MMSSTRESIRLDSLQISAENSRTLSPVARPFIMSSAKPEIEVSGVLSSWETLAENSRLSRSRCSRSVTSMRSRTAPEGLPRTETGLAMIRQVSPSAEWETSLLAPRRASFTAGAAAAAAGLEGALSGRGKVSPSAHSGMRLRALRLATRTLPDLSSRTSPSLMESVRMVNSFCRRTSSSSRSPMVRFCSSMRLSRGFSSA